MLDTGLDGGDQLQLPGAGDRRGGQPERLLEHCERDDDGRADTTPPTAPSNLAATATASSAINLSWTASTDNVGVTGYRVERCQGAGCSNFAQVGTPSGTTFNDTGLTAGDQLQLPGAGDGCGGQPERLFEHGERDDAVAPDTHTADGAVEAGATATGSSQINLSWTASTDNVGVTGYRVERCQGAGCTNFAQMGTPAGPTFSDTGLTAATSYSYRVRATDAAGNLSGTRTLQARRRVRARATIAFVQLNAATPQTPQSTVSVTYTAAQTAGNLNVWPSAGMTARRW